MKGYIENGTNVSLILHPQIASLIRSGQNLYGILQRIMPEINQELDNVAAVSNALLSQIPQAPVPPQLRAQVTELADATKQLAALVQSITPRLRWAILFVRIPKQISLISH